MVWGPGVGLPVSWRYCHDRPWRSCSHSTQFLTNFKLILTISITLYELRQHLMASCLQSKFHVRCSKQLISKGWSSLCPKLDDQTIESPVLKKVKESIEFNQSFGWVTVQLLSPGTSSEPSMDKYSCTIFCKLQRYLEIFCLFISYLVKVKEVP